MRKLSGLLTLSLLGFSVLGGPALSADLTWEQAGFGKPVFQRLDLKGALPASARYTHELRPTFVVFRKAGWTPEKVKAQATCTQRVLSQCGLKMAGVDIWTVDAPHASVSLFRETGLEFGATGEFGFNEPGEHYPGTCYQVAAATPLKARPIVYFIRKFDEDPMAPDPGVNAWAAPARFNQGKPYVRSNSPLLDTAWMTSLIVGPQYAAERDPTYCTTAHELGHVLGHLDHLSEGERNLMADTPQKVNGSLTRTQCSAILKHPSVRRL